MIYNYSFAYVIRLTYTILWTYSFGYLLFTYTASCASPYRLQLFNRAVSCGSRVRPFNRSINGIPTAGFSNYSFPFIGGYTL